MALSPDGRTLAVGRYGGTVELWDPASLARTATLETNVALAAVAFSPTGSLLAASGPSGAIRLWELERRRLVGELFHTNYVTRLSFSPDGRHLASTHPTSGVWVWDLESREAIRRYPDFRSLGAHGGPICFSPDGRYLAVGCDSGHIGILDWAANRVVADIPAHDQPIKSLAYSPDGKLLASGSGFSADEIRLWNPATRELAGSLTGHRSWVCELQFSGDGQRLVSASADQTIGIWDVPKRRLSLRLRGHLDEVYTLVFDEGRTNLISGCKDGTLARWDIDKVRQRALRLDIPGWTRLPAWAAEGSGVAVLDQQGAVALWRPGDSEELSVIDGLGTNNVALATALGRGLLACATGKGPVRIWSLQSANLVTNLGGHVGGIDTFLYGRGLRFSKEEDFLLAFDGAGLVTLWDARNWTKHSACAETNGASCAALSPDGRLLVFGSNKGRLYWWDAVRGHRVAETTGHRTAPVGLDFSPDGSTLASASVDGTVALWDTRTRRRTAYWKADLNGIQGVAFSRAGTQLVTALGGGRAARLWDLKTQRELVTLAAPGGLFPWVQFSPDGAALLCGSYDGHSYLWRTPSFAELDAAR
jgi:WD40 repeat protein